MASLQQQQEILISLKADARQLTNEFQRAKNALKKDVAEMQKRIDSLRFTQKGTFRKKWTKDQKAQLERLTVAQREARTQIQGMTSDYQIQAQKSKESIQGQKAAIQDMQKPVKNLSGLMLQASLSALFFGMAMRQAALAAWKTSTKTFQEIMHSVDGTVTSFDLLSGSLKYLQFSVGQALEPLAMWLVPIVDRITDIVQQNPGFTKFAVAFGAIAGSVLMIAGQIGTAALGFSAMGTGLRTSAGLANGLKKTLGILMATNYLIDASLSLEEGDFGEAVGDMLLGTGIFTAMAGKKKAGAIIYGIGTAITLVDAVMEGGGKITPQEFGKFMTKASGGLMFFNPAVGAAVLTMGLALQFLTPETSANIVDVLSIVVGAVATAAATLIDALMWPFIDTINKGIELINMFKSRDNQIGTIDQWSNTKNAAGRIGDLWDNIRMRSQEEFHNDPDYEFSTPASGQNPINISLDGPATEDFLAGKIVSYSQSNMTHSGM